MFNRLRFNWKAQTAHGLHSPFVYKLYTEVIDPIYQQSPEKLEEAMMHGIGAYLQLSSGQLHVINLTQIEEAQIEGVEQLFLQSEENIFICLYPNQNTLTQAIWQRLYKNKTVIHSIELFELGILSLRKTAPKQHFWLKKS
jgi:hypothetical protein